MTVEIRQKPVVCAYFPIFLVKDMRHAYRQLTRLRKFRVHVISHKRKESADFPFDQNLVSILPSADWKRLRRIWFKLIGVKPASLSRRDIFHLKTAIDRVKPSVVHIYFGNAAVGLLPVLRDLRYPLVVSFHGADATVDADRVDYRRQLTELFHCSTLILARSVSLLTCISGLGCPAEKLRLNRTGISADEIPFVRRVPPADGKWRFLQACRLVEKKGLEDSLRAFSRVCAVQPNAELCQRISLAGQRVVADRFGSKEQIARLEEYYQEAMRIGGAPDETHKRSATHPHNTSSPAG